MEKDQEKLYSLIVSQLLHDGFTETAQHLATSLVSLSTVTQCISSNQLLEIYKSHNNDLEQDKSPIILMIEDESGKTTKVQVPASSIRMEDEKMSEEEETMTTEESTVAMVTNEDTNVYTTMVSMDSSHGDNLYVSNIDTAVDQTEQKQPLLQHVDHSFTTDEPVNQSQKRKRQDDDSDALDGFGEFGPSDPSEDEEGNDKQSDEDKLFKRGADGFVCSICDGTFSMEIMLKLHIAAAHPDICGQVFDKVELRKIKTKRKKEQGSFSPGQQKIDCIYCEKSFSMLKFPAHVATSGHRRNLALKKGQKTTLDTLQEMAAASKIKTAIKSETSGLSPGGVGGDATLGGATGQTGCLYSSAISCFRCNSMVSRDKFLKEHLRVCARKIYCEVCCKLFELGRASEHHDQKCLPSIPYRCSNCGKGHVKLSALEHHVSQCKATAKFLCPQCYRCFDTFLECKVHESDEPTIYKCATCSATFSEQAQLTAHETEHKENKEAQKGEAGNESVKKEGEDVDAQKKHPFICDECGMGFRHKSSLEVHEYSHKDERRFMCDECGRSYKYQTSLKNHIYTHMKDEAKPHQCRFCGKRFSSAGAVKVHIRKHTGHKPYKCTVCDKTFSQLGPLKAHSRLHSGEKPLVCSLCNYDFSSHGSLSAHLKSVHKRKPFYCSNCDKGFNTESALNKHLPSHGIHSGTTVVIETLETHV